MGIGLSVDQYTELYNDSTPYRHLNKGIDSVLGSLSFSMLGFYFVEGASPFRCCEKNTKACRQDNEPIM